MSPDGIICQTVGVELPMVKQQHRTVPLPEIAVPAHQGGFAEHRAHIDGMVPGQDKQAVRVRFLHGADELAHCLVGEPEGTQVLLDFLVFPNIFRGVRHHLFRIIAVFGQRNLKGPVIAGGIEEMELVRAAGFFLLED